MQIKSGNNEGFLTIVNNWVYLIYGIDKYN